MSVAVGLLAGACGGNPLCIMAGSSLVLSAVLEMANGMLSSTKDYIPNSGLCKIGT